MGLIMIKTDLLMYSRLSSVESRQFHNASGACVRGLSEEISQFDQQRDRTSYDAPLVSQLAIRHC